jgi:formate hydrogenlyase transcriptional activator
MDAIPIATARAIAEGNLDSSDRLIIALSSRFTRLHVDEIEPAIAGALEEIGTTVGVDASRLLELTEDGAVSVAHAWLRPGTTRLDPVLRPWLLTRLARSELVAVTRADDLPPDAGPEREFARRTGVSSILAVPVSIAGGATCALVLEGARIGRSWPQSLVDRMRLLAEILATAVQRTRHESMLRASLVEIERLNARLRADNSYLQEEIKSYHDFDDVVGQSGALRLALTRLSQVAPMNSTVLLLGETGTGKELFARALHDRSRRRGRALVRVNCAALPPTLVESELFGHEKGAFTGAATLRQGRFELADGGTLFLDEIGDLPLEIQAKLLRVLQEGEFERVGSSRTRKVDVRLIAATHRDLDADVAAGRFRPDLFYRLSVFPIYLPALRERRDDVVPLVWFFIHRHQRELGRRITKVPQAVMDVLRQHAWPGNVRELENVIERAMIRSMGETLELDDMPGFHRALAPVATSGTLDEVQRSHIEAVLQECGWRINGTSNAAARLGLHPNTLRFRMKKLGIVAPHPRPRPATPARG